MAEIVIRQRRRPLVEVYYPVAPSLEDFDLLFARYAELSRNGVPVGYLIDMRCIDPLTCPSSVRQHVARLFQRYFGELKRVTVCEARVVSSPLTATALTAFDWLTGTKWPCTNFTSVEKAEKWVVERLQRRGLEVPR